MKSRFRCDFEKCCPLVELFNSLQNLGLVVEACQSCDRGFILQTSFSVRMGGSALSGTWCVMGSLIVRTTRMNLSVIRWRAAVTSVIRTAAFLKPSYVTGKKTVWTAVMKQTVVWSCATRIMQCTVPAASCKLWP